MFISFLVSFNLIEIIMHPAPLKLMKSKSYDTPLILIFSARERIRGILSVGLQQCHYRIIQAINSNVASLKANQFVPDLVIADITAKNTKDILMLNRLHHSERTRSTPLLAVVPRTIKEKLEKILNAKADIEGTPDNAQFFLIEYPFNFSDLLKKITHILARFGNPLPQKQNLNEDEQFKIRTGQRLFDPNVKIATKLRDIAAQLQKQWVFPYTVIKALDILGSEKSCGEELAKCIKSDLSASAALLKVANTVFYAKRQKRITDIKECVVRIGFQQTRNLLSCFSLIDLTSESYGESGFTRPEFWLHSLAVALIASKLCEDSGYRRPELAFLTGLIHDLGKVPLDNNFKNVFPKLLEETTSRGEMFYRTELYLMNFSHADVGHFLTNQWNFPSAISRGILNHHTPERILEATPAEDRILFEAVFIANQIAKAMNLGHSCDEIIQEIPYQMLRDLSIPKGPTANFISTVIRNLNQMAKFLNIGIKKLTLAQPAHEVTEGEILFVYGDHPDFHPLVLALRHNGYKVLISKQLPPEPDPSIRVIIIMPEQGAPLDIMLYDDEQESTSESSPHKIFIMDVEPHQVPVQGFDDSSMIFINQDNLDMRFILHILDKFYGRVIVPQRTDVEQD